MEVPGRPSGLGWMPDGSLLVVSMTDKRLARRDADGAAHEHADISSFCAGLANDMVVDAWGRAYVGNFGFDLYGGGQPAPAVLVRVDPDGAATVAAEELWFPNGSVILPDERTLIVGETAGARYTAFSIADDGALADRRVWAQIAPSPQMGSLGEMLASLRFPPTAAAWTPSSTSGPPMRSARAPARRPRRRDRRSDPRPRRPGLLCLHARRSGRAHAAVVRGA